MARFRSNLGQTYESTTKVDRNTSNATGLCSQSWRKGAILLSWMKLPSKDRLQSGAKHDDSVFCDGDETMLAQNFFHSLQFTYDRTTHIIVAIAYHKMLGE